jgi:hypothetical protein
MCSQANTLSSQATQDAITWAHAAGCPCDSELHQFAAWLQHDKKTVRDVNMPKRRRWHAPLFKLCYTRTGVRLAQVVVFMSIVNVLLPMVVAWYPHYIYWRQMQWLQQQWQQLGERQLQQWKQQQQLRGYSGSSHYSSSTSHS